MMSVSTELPIAMPHPMSSAANRQAEMHELLLHNLLETSDFGIVLLCDLSGERTVVAANRHFCDLFQFTLSRIIGLPAERLAARCRKRVVQENSASALLGEGFTARGPQQHCEIILREPQKQVLRQISSPAKNNQGEICGRLLLYKNVTEDRQAEDQALHRQKMESIGTLAGGIAHDFNNILTAIFGYTGALMMELSDNSSAMEKLQQLQKSANRAAELTSNLLAFSRKNPHLPHPINLSHLCENTANMLMFTLPPGIHLEIDPLPDIPYVEADPTQIQQVLSQLIVNARDAILGEGKISISTRVGHDTQTSADGNPIPYAVIDVEDTGVGVPKDSISRIFEPFYTTKDLGKGVGLGLSMVYGVVKQHLGFIEVESAPNQGSRFSVYLPVMKEQPTFEEAEDPVLPTEKINACVMVVEDEEDLRELCNVALSEIVTEVILARDGLEALQFFRMREGRMDLVLLDITMPVMGGEDCFHELRDINPDIRVLVCSGYSEEMGASGLLKAGAIGFIPKPYTLSTLVQRVLNALA